MRTIYTLLLTVFFIHSAHAEKKLLCIGKMNAETPFSVKVEVDFEAGKMHIWKKVEQRFKDHKAWKYSTEDMGDHPIFEASQNTLATEQKNEAFAWQFSLESSEMKNLLNGTAEKSIEATITINWYMYAGPDYELLSKPRDDYSEKIKHEYVWTKWGSRSVTCQLK